MQKGKKLKPDEQEAKLGVLKDLRGQASSMMGDKVKGNKFGLSPDAEEGAESAMKKAQGELHTKSDDKEPDGLGKKGEEAEEELHADLDHDHEEGESEAHKAKVFEGEKSLDDCSPEELEQKIQLLMDLKRSKESK